MNLSPSSNATGQPQYSAALFRLNASFLARVSEISERRALRDLLGNWLLIFLLARLAATAFYSDYALLTYVPLVFIIAGRIGSLVNTLHEASHGFLSKDKNRNDRYATWLAAFPLGIHYQGYAAHHAIHHTYAATPKDVPTDLEKYREVNFTRPQVYFHLVKDLLGITAIVTAFKYFANPPRKGFTEAPLFLHRLGTLAQIAMAQGIVLGVLFQFDLVLYLLFWIVPCISPHMFLMRFRGIAEHGLSGQLERPIFSPVESRFYTRSFLTSVNCYSFRPFVWLERALIGSLNIQYHHEHHLYPQVPHYHLAELHAAIRDEVHRRNPLAYETGYFKAALRNLFWMPSENLSPLPE